MKTTVTLNRQNTAVQQLRFQGAEQNNILSTKQIDELTELPNQLDKRRHTKSQHQQQQERKEFWQSVGINILLLAMSVLSSIGGVFSHKRYVNNQHPVAALKTVQQDIGEEFDNKSTYHISLLEHQKMQKEVNTYINELAESFISEMANGDEALENTLRDQFNTPNLVISQIVDSTGTDLMQYVKDRMANDQPLELHQFFHERPGFESLTGKELESLTSTIFDIVNENPSLDSNEFTREAVQINRKNDGTQGHTHSPERQLRDALDTIVGNQVTGLNFDGLRHIETSTDAMEWLGNILNNEHNLTGLNTETRQRFLDYAQKTFDKHEFKTSIGVTSVGMQIAAGALFLMAVLFGGGLAIRTKNSIQRMSNDVKYRDGKSLTLIETPGKEEDTAVVESEFTELSDQLFNLRQEAAKEHPEVQAFMQQINAASKSPELANVFRTLTHKNKRHGTMSKHDFALQTLAHAEDAMNNRNFFPEVSLVSTPLGPEAHGLENIDTSRFDGNGKKAVTEAIRISKNLAVQELKYINQLVYDTKTRLALEETTKRLDELNSDDAPDSKAQREIRQLEHDKEQQETIHRTSIRSTETARGNVDELEDQLMVCQLAMLDTGNHAEFESALAELEGLQSDGKRISRRHNVDQISEQSTLAGYVRRAAARDGNDNTARERARKLIAERAETLPKTKASGK